MNFDKETKLQFAVYILLALLILTMLRSCSNKDFYENELVDVAEAKYNELFYDYLVLYDSHEKINKHSAVFDQIQDPGYYNGAMNEVLSYEIERKRAKDEYEG